MPAARHPVPRLAAPLAAIVAILLSGCSKTETERAPAACLVGPGTYIRALAAAPDAVRLAADTPISSCLVRSQGGGELAAVGSALVLAATRLNVAARRDPGGPEAVDVGYLVGAAERGAADTAGIHTDLIRRLNTAARYDPSGTPPASFQRAFDRGYRAGRADG
jgi:hypothetical protein